MPDLITLKDIIKTYRVGEVDIPALRGVTATISKGEFVAIMGHSGSGKTTLMNIIGCLDQPSSGEYILEGDKSISRLSRDDLAGIRNRHIGFVFQSFNLLKGVSALENVMLPLYYSAAVSDKPAGSPANRGKGALQPTIPGSNSLPLKLPAYGNSLTGRQKRQRAMELLERVGLGHRAHHKPTQLSGGEQQRVAIARALVNNPLLILADEPTGNLDTKTSYEIMEMFKKLHSEGISLIIVTHEKDIAAYTQRVITIQDGKVVV